MATIDDLVNSTTALTTAVNVAKATLDEKVTAAASSATAAAASAVTAASVLPLAPPKVNTIGIPGTAGFGVGICPPTALPSGFTPLPGYQEPTHINYGNYQFTDGSIMCWIPKNWYRIGHASNPTYATYGVNSVDVKGLETFNSTSAANAAGYALHRMFMDGGVEKDGAFVDKYKCSQRAWGTGIIASSIANAPPISTAANHNPIGGLTATSGINTYYAAITAAHARDGVNGAVNASSMFFCNTRFITAGLALLSLAHGQASSSTTYCAWYSSGSTNYPKGCNNNALHDCDDSSVVYLTDGYSNCGKTGSGSPFAKTTHNGQACGVADLNGLMYEVNPAITCLTSTKTITGITQANPAVVTSAAHGLVNGQQILLTSIGGMTQLNSTIATVANKTTDTFELSGVNSTEYGAFTSGGTITIGTYYVIKTATDMKTLTSGNTLSTDVWGATGVAAHSDVITVPYGNGGIGKRFGNGSNQVLSEATSGDAWKLTGLGFPKDTNGVSGAGSNLFGTDYFYEYHVNDMVPFSSCSWSGAGGAGVWCVYLGDPRTDGSDGVGFRCACYPA